MYMETKNQQSAYSHMLHYKMFSTTEHWKSSPPPQKRSTKKKEKQQAVLLGKSKKHWRKERESRSAEAQ